MLPEPLPLTLTVPEAGRLLSLGRDASYAAAARGEIPTLRLGRRLVVPTHKLLELLGIPPQTGSEVGPVSPTTTVTDPHHMEQSHEQQSSSACGTTHVLRNVI